jgi:hypothetical protein
MPEVPVELHFPVGVLMNNTVVETMLVYLRRVPVVGEAIDFGEDAGLGEWIDGSSFTVKTICWQVHVIAPGINKPPVVVLER